MLERNFPESFDFYHLGSVICETVAAQPKPDWVKRLGDHALAAFSIKGEAEHVLLVAFDLGLDSSIYLEMGNILASRLTPPGSLLAPPRMLDSARAEALSSTMRLASERTYVHRHGRRDIPMQVLLLSPVLEKTGNA